MTTPEELAELCESVSDSCCGECYKQGFLTGYRAASPKWLPVEESLPEPGQVVFMYVNYELDGQRITNVEYGYYDKGTWRGGLTAYSHGFVTHWIPLPKPPGEIIMPAKRRTITIEEARDMFPEKV